MLKSRCDSLYDESGAMHIVEQFDEFMIINDKVLRKERDGSIA